MRELTHEEEDTISRVHDALMYSVSEGDIGATAAGAMEEAAELAMRQQAILAEMGKLGTA